MIAHPQEFNGVVNLLLPLVQYMLNEHGAFLPVGAVLHAKRGAGLVPHDLRQPGETVPELIESITGLLRSQATDDGCLAVAFCVDVRVVDPRCQQKTDAVQIVFEHRSGEALLVFFPYRKAADGTFDFAHPFALAAACRMFGDRPNTHVN